MEHNQECPGYGCQGCKCCQSENAEAERPSGAADCWTLSASIEEVSISEHPSFQEARNDWGVIPAHFETIEWDEWGEPVRQEWVPENRAGYRPEFDGKSLADMWDAEKQDWAIQPPGMNGITSFLRPKYSWANEIAQTKAQKKTDEH